MITWFLTSRAGRALLLLLVVGILVVAATAAVSAWKARIYKQGYDEALVVAEAQRKAYFDEAHAMAAKITEAAASAATRIEIANASAGSRVDATVAQALKRWTREPLIVMSEGKCKVSPDLGATWNAINKEATQ